VTIFGFGATQALRLASNLILTRLLVPEVFGFMSLCYGLLEGLAMFSAVGEGPAIVRDKRGDDPKFLNTAWTVQSIRGVYLCLASCVFALPMAHFYGQQQLVALIPVVGLTCVLEGFYSTAIHTARRHLALGRLTLIDLISQVASIVATVVLAYLYRSVWALPLGGLVCVLMLVLPHRYRREFATSSAGTASAANLAEFRQMDFSRALLISSRGKVIDFVGLLRSDGDAWRLCDGCDQRAFGSAHLQMSRMSCHPPSAGPFASCRYDKPITARGLVSMPSSTGSGFVAACGQLIVSPWRQPLCGSRLDARNSLLLSYGCLIEPARVFAWRWASLGLSP
jgi:hypothetical protein